MPHNVYDISTKYNTILSDNSDLSVKLHYYNEKSNSTYLGLTNAQYLANPNQNTAINDQLLVERIGISAVHNEIFDTNFSASHAGYAYYTHRYWWRQDYDRSDDNSDGLDSNGNAYTRISGTGQNDGGSIFWKNSNGGRNRAYRVAGILQTIEFNEFKFGNKLHYEIEDNKRVNGDHKTARSGLIKSDEERETIALSNYVNHTMNLDKHWALNSGVRLETFRQKRLVHRNSNATSMKSGSTGIEMVVIPGIGTTYQVNNSLNLFAGAHRGFAPPRFSDAINSSGVDQELDAELSWNYEAGFRSDLGDQLTIDGAVYFVDYQNQVVNASEASGISKVSGGKTQHSGIELELEKTFSNAISNFDFNTGLSVSSSKATIVGNRLTSSGVTLLLDGKELPYTPNTLYSFHFGLENKTAMIRLEGIYVGNMMAYDISKEDPSTITAGSADGTKGPIESHFVWNLSASLLINDQIETFLSVKNVGNTKYIASRNPSGIFPGMERHIEFGVKLGL